MSFVNSASMNLPIPTVGSETGPQYAFDVNTSLTLIDQHDHSPGKGVPITPAGLNINAALSFNNNNATNVASVIFQQQSSANSTLLALSSAPGSGSGTSDLFFTDGNGTQIQITKSGVVNASAASIPGESYNAGTFIWTQTQSALPTTPANFDIGSITLRPNIAATTFGVKVSPPSSIASQYNISLPLLPSVQSFVTIDNTGVMAAPIAFNQGITGANIATGTVTRQNLVPLGQQLSASSGVYNTNTVLGLQPITNLSVTITTTGRPVMIALIADGTGIGFVKYTSVSGGGAGTITIQRGVTSIASMASPTTTSSTVQPTIPSSAYQYVDIVGAGTYTYTANASLFAAADQMQVNATKLIVYEL